MTRIEFDFSRQPGLVRRNQNPVNTERPLVSIITPYYNGGKYLLQTCNCVLDQTFPYFEWIIVDDGSTNPEDLQILEGIGALDPRIRILHKENGGPSAARNYGVRHAVTDLILPLDCDDLLESTFLEYCWWMLYKNPGAAWAYTDSVGFQNEEYLWNVPFDPKKMARENLLAITALIRKDVFLSVDGYGEDVKLFNEDWEFWLKLIAKGCYPAQSQGDYLFWYRRTDSGVQSSIQGDTARSKKNRQIIADAAGRIGQPAAPVIYPHTYEYNWEPPRMSQWDKCVRPQKSKQNILFLVAHTEMGGADKFNLDLITGLNPDQYDIGIITTVRSPQSWQQRFRQVTPELFNLANFVDPRDYAEFISYYIRSRKVDILFLSNSYHGYYLAPWLREQFPDLVIVDYVHMEEWYWRNGGYARTSGMIAAVTEKTYVCNSATRDVMLHHYGRAPESVETVHIGVDEEFFDRKKTEPGLLYRELGIGENRPIVLFICRLHPQKRPFLMLQIAKQVKLQIPDAVFAVVGDGPQETELRETARTMGLEDTVRFLGAKKNVQPYYRDAKLTLVCSLKEGLSLTAYESCAMGVPVVSSDVGGQRDLVDAGTGALIPCLQDEETGLDDRSFPEAEVKNFTDAIVRLLTDRSVWEETSQNCRRKIEESFTVRKMVDRFDAEFRCLTTDPVLAEKRRAVSRNLQSLRPLAAELYTAEMEFQQSESLRETMPRETLRDKVIRVLKTQGFSGLIRKAILKINRTLFR